MDDDVVIDALASIYFRAAHDRTTWADVKKRTDDIGVALHRQYGEKAAETVMLVRRAEAMVGKKRRARP